MNFLAPRGLQKLRKQMRERGLQAILKEVGWKVVALVILFYLVRDTLLYLVIPYLLARGLLID